MFSKFVLGSLAMQASLASPLSRPLTCAPVSGNKTIDAFQLYPENADFDTRRCVLYSSVLYNATAVAWDPYRKEVLHTFEAPGLSGDSLLHASGVRVDPLDRLSVIIDAGVSFDTSGQNVEGGNFLTKFDLRDNSFLWKANLTDVTGGVYSGFQDSECDEAGNTFVLGTYPSSLIKVSADGESAIPWYLVEPANHTIHGFSGIARKDDFLVVGDNTDGQLYRFDIRASKGTPIHVPISKGKSSKTERIGENLDGILLPQLYAGTVLLASDNTNGTVILRSSNGKWDSAENLGTISNPFLSQGGYTVASVQIADSIYSVTEFFGDAIDGAPGNRTAFPLRDITKEIEVILKA
ncbi:trichothecene biosynthetic gene cluster protein [Fusarium heterosporum]|uniref:Trichothecene biosynthetic gene cluster protein n=1 Tax=Fusarium heterosporum TaxID=42747 RepID=A0A8H5TI98_FUSHE|nr:trichothecene biosynthetic gene cluster protein [Fusarium heterosporum]